MKGSGNVGINTNGYTPAADTTSGAAGTVTGSERSKLQGIVTALVTPTADGVARATDKAKLDGVAAGAQVNVLESVNSVAPIITSGIAGKAQTLSIAAATPSAAGSQSAADKAKLDSLGAVYASYLAANTAFASGSQNFPSNTTTVSLSLPLGVIYLVQFFARVEILDNFTLNMIDSYANPIAPNQSILDTVSGASRIIQILSPTFRVIVPATATSCNLYLTYTAINAGTAYAAGPNGADSATGIMAVKIGSA